MLLIKNRRTTHAERVNNSKKIVELVIGDIVMTRTTIQSDASTSRVAKLSYQVRRPFFIAKRTSHVSCLVQRLYNFDNPPELKFMASDLYPLPPSLKRASLLIVLVFDI